MNLKKKKWKKMIDAALGFRGDFRLGAILRIGGEGAFAMQRAIVRVRNPAQGMLGVLG